MSRASNLTLFRLILVFTLAFGAIFLVGRSSFQKIYFGIETLVGRPLPQTNGRFNLLLLGVGGEGHEGPEMTDSIILASFQLSTGKLILVSLPRDLWDPSLNAKINSAYTTGGLSLAKSTISNIIGQPIHFVARIDFSTFSKTIDILGGVDVTVEKTFDDPKYPLAGKENDDCGGIDPEYLCRYESIHFDAGVQHMDGATALKFARSRHSLDLSEGTDFARSRRQSQVISAVKTKLLSLQNLGNTQLFSNLYNLARSSVVTDIDSAHYSSVVQLGLRALKQPHQSFSLTSPPLINPKLSAKYQFQWVLVAPPEDPNYIFNYINSVLN